VGMQRLFLTAVKKFNSKLTGVGTFCAAWRRGISQRGGGKYQELEITITWEAGYHRDQRS